MTLSEYCALLEENEKLASFMNEVETPKGKRYEWYMAGDKCDVCGSWLYLDGNDFLPQRSTEEMQKQILSIEIPKYCPTCNKQRGTRRMFY